MTDEEIRNRIADLWGVENRSCDGNHPRNGCEWEKVLRTIEIVEAASCEAMVKAYDNAMLKVCNCGMILMGASKHIPYCTALEIAPLRDSLSPIVKEK